MSFSSSQHHSFDLHLAVVYGIEKAILIHHFQHWIRINKFKEINFKEGRTWTFQTRKDIQAHFPYWTYDQVRYLCDALVEQGILIKGKFNKNPLTHTLWYAFANEKAFNVDDESVANYYRNSNNFCDLGKVPNACGKSPKTYKDKDTILEDSLTNSKESSLKRAKEKSASPPPPKKSFYEGKFEDKIEVTVEQYVDLCEKFGSDTVNEAVKKIYDWALINPSKFRSKKRHDLFIKNWIERDLKTSKKIDYDADLNPEQKKTWELNKELIQLLKEDNPKRFSGFNWWYKGRLLKNKNDSSFDISGLVNHRDFCRQLDKHYNLKTEKVRFPNE
jgi:hypothetical protein